MNKKERALLITVILKEPNLWPTEELTKELSQLSESAAAEAVEEIIIHRPAPTASLFIGTGKAEEIHNIIHEKEIDVVIFNNDLSNAQQKNLEDILGVKVIDYTQLILDIFARRAKSLEGKVQVELAQLEYLLPRLAGKGIMLSRLGGGIGTRGPGEQKLEVDRRKISKRVVKLKRDLDELKKRRHVVSVGRKNKAFPLLAIVGYTNAGKSSLMNLLCGEKLIADDRLFATLDTVVRRLVLPNNQTTLISDTVGFIHHLPHHLIEAFKATLEEVISADLLLHVIDASSPISEQKEEAVYEVLKQLGVEHTPIIKIFNKIDKLPDVNVLKKKKFEESAAVSVKENKNINELLEKIIAGLSSELQEIKVTVLHNQLKLLDIIHKYGNVVKEEYRGEGVYIEAFLPIIWAKKVLTKLNSVLI
ncbi:MAG: GTPase HflX [Candidatus Omnitrophota bacterium]